eukprot:6591939-Lingulodinium_polyedra.AAC.1
MSGAVSHCSASGASSCVARADAAVVTDRRCELLVWLSSIARGLVHSCVCLLYTSDAADDM